MYTHKPKYTLKPEDVVDGIPQSKEVFHDISGGAGSFVKQTQGRKWGFELIRPDKTWLDAIKHIASYPVCKTLEIGAASGPFPRSACKAFEVSLYPCLSFLKGYWAIDPDQRAMAVLHETLPEIPEEQLISSMLDGEALKRFGRTKFNVVVISRVFHFLPDEMVIEQLCLVWQCLAQTGTVFLSGLTTALHALQAAESSSEAFRPETSSCGTVTVNLYELAQHTHGLIPPENVEAHQKSGREADSHLMLRDAYAYSRLIQEAGYYVERVEYTSYYNKNEEELYSAWVHEPDTPPNHNCHLVIRKNSPAPTLFSKQVAHQVSIREREEETRECDRSTFQKPFK